MWKSGQKLRGLKKLSPHPPRNYIIRPTPHIVTYPGPQPTPQQLKNPAGGGTKTASRRALIHTLGNKIKSLSLHKRIVYHSFYVHGAVTNGHCACSWYKSKRYLGLKTQYL